jgi:hypothetical protein
LCGERSSVNKISSQVQPLTSGPICSINKRHVSSSSMLRYYTLDATTSRYSLLNRDTHNCSTPNAKIFSGGGVWGALKVRRIYFFLGGPCLSTLGGNFVPRTQSCRVDNFRTAERKRKLIMIGSWKGERERDWAT